MKDIYHILPINDLLQHRDVTKKGEYIMVNGEVEQEIISECACCPKIKYEENAVLVIHDAWDGRQ